MRYTNYWTLGLITGLSVVLSGAAQAAEEPTAEVRIRNKHSGMVLSDRGSTNPGTKIIQFPWNGANRQRWRLDRLDDGSYKIVNQHSGLVLDDPGFSTNPGTEIWQYPWNGGNNQRWYLDAAFP